MKLLPEPQLLQPGLYKALRETIGARNCPFADEDNISRGLWSYRFSVLW